MSVEDATPIEVIRLDGKSVLVLTHPNWLDSSIKQRTLEKMRDAFGPDHHMLILDGGFDVKVVQP